MFDTAIPFCTYDIRYIDKVINSVRGVTNKIIIVYSDKLFNGENENLELINSVKERNSDCIFYKMDFEPGKSSRYHNSKSRDLSCQISLTDNILFLDADEIFEKNKLDNWIKSNKLPDVVSFSNYWYYRDSKYRVGYIDDSIVMVNKKYCTKDLLYTEMDRSVFKLIDIPNRILHARDENDKPFCHHFSWVLTKDEMLKKIRSWPHKDDRDWKPLVEEEFSRPFNGQDIFGNKDYTILIDEPV
jgi:hypothetical protein